MSKHSNILKINNFYKEQNNKKSKKIPIETYEDKESVNKVIKFLNEQQPNHELKCNNELSQAFKEHSSRLLSLQEESKKNEIIEKYVINLQNLLLLILLKALKKNIKELIHFFLNLFIIEFHVIIIKLLKLELF